MKKRFICILSMILALCLCTAITASAQAPGGGDVASPNNIYTGVQGDINGYTELSCTLTRKLSWGYAEAYVQTSNVSGIVDVYIRRPNGVINYVGAVAATGGSTGSTSLYVMESGTYTFIFDPSTDATLSVNAIIRD